MQFEKRTLLLLLMVAVCTGGCHRGYYRRQADAEAYALIRQKTCDPRWDLPDTTIEVRPESRMFDPFSSDHPPLPPDDPTSAELMQLVDDKKGYPHWHANGDTDFVESPEWRAYLPMNEEGVVLIDGPRAINLALTHSTVYQRQREELYLSALDVSLERFGFDTQAFAGWNSFFTADGPLTGSGSSSTLDVSTRSGGQSLSRLGATGSTLVIGLANSVIWQFAGPDTQSASSVINFSFVQPLLRGGGRDRILESLTQAERTLLANVRQFERFRQGFFLQVSTGRNIGGLLSRAGAFLNNPSLGSGAAGGLLGLLRTQQSIRIQEFNVASLRNVLEQFQEFHKAERLDSLQLSQTESSLYDSERRLLSARTDYQTQLDQFKRTLGLPPDLPVEIRDPFLSRFELIDDANNIRQNQIAILKVEIGDALLETSGFLEANRRRVEPPPIELAPEDADDPEKILAAERARLEQVLREEYEIDWSDELRQKVASILPVFDKITPVLQVIRDEDIERVRGDIERYSQIRPRRAEALAKLRALVESGTALQYDIQTTILEEASLENPEDLTGELQRLAEMLVQNQGSVDQLKQTVDRILTQGETLPPKELYRTIDQDLLTAIPKQLTGISQISLDLSLVQARAKTDSIELPRIELDSATAIEIARCCRLDWMNARASLVDSWRQIEFVADQLESQLDFVFEGDMGNTGNNPFSLNYKNGSLRGGFRFDSPLTRLAERNQYRQQLIQYQRDRRAYYEYEDEVKRGLRRTLREIELNKILFELSRRSIKVGVQQVELARLKLDEPPQGIGGAGGGGRTQLGATTARDLTTALNSLQNFQNSFLDVWVSYEVLRRDLDFDLGTMHLTDDGFWIDPGSIDASIGEACGARATGEIDLFPEAPGQLNSLPVEIQLEPVPNPESSRSRVAPGSTTGRTPNSGTTHLSSSSDLFAAPSPLDVSAMSTLKAGDMKASTGSIVPSAGANSSSQRTQPNQRTVPASTRTLTDRNLRGEPLEWPSR